MPPAKRPEGQGLSDQQYHDMHDAARASLEAQSQRTESMRQVESVEQIIKLGQAMLAGVQAASTAAECSAEDQISAFHKTIGKALPRANKHPFDQLDLASTWLAHKEANQPRSDGYFSLNPKTPENQEAIATLLLLQQPNPALFLFAHHDAWISQGEIVQLKGNPKLVMDPRSEDLYVQVLPPKPPRQTKTGLVPGHNGVSFVLQDISKQLIVGPNNIKDYLLGETSSL